MANEEQAKFWTETGGPVWLANEALLEKSAGQFGVAAIDAAAVRDGESVIDIGCGTGTTLVDLAQRAGDEGRVTGVDISSLLLGRARERVTEAGLSNVDLLEADAQTHAFAESADLLFSRFGVMFFDDSVAAFSNLRRALRPTGRFAFVCWQHPQLNQWMSVPSMAAASVLGAPPPPPPDAPGPFRFGDGELLQNILRDAGFDRINIQDFRTTMDTPVNEARERLGFVSRMGPLGAVFAESDAATQQRALDAVIEAAEPFRSDGLYRLPAATWIVTAKAS